MKEYLKMSDVFIPMDENDVLGATISRVLQAKYITHAINNHDELVAMNQELIEALTTITQIDWKKSLVGLDRPTDFAERQSALHAFGSAVEIAKKAINNVVDLK